MSVATYGPWCICDEADGKHAIRIGSGFFIRVQMMEKDEIGYVSVEDPDWALKYFANSELYWEGDKFKIRFRKHKGFYVPVNEHRYCYEEKKPLTSPYQLRALALLRKAMVNSSVPLVIKIQDQAIEAFEKNKY